MEKAIEKQVKELGQDIAEIKKLTISNESFDCVAGLTEEWKSLETLELENLGLKSLESFPILPMLKKLVLNDNQISGCLEPLSKLPELEELELMDNKISETSTLEPLSKIKTLKYLSLDGCPLDSIENRESILTAVPNLEFLDAIRKTYDENSEELTDEELEEEEDAGSDDGSLSKFYNKSYTKDSEDEDEDFEADDAEEDDIELDEEDEIEDEVAKDHKRGTKRKLP